MKATPAHSSDTTLRSKQPFLERRARILGAVRSFFTSRGFLEVETPVCLRAPLPERHIDAVPCGDHYLATSPEPHMKRLLAAGYERIFQISKCFRAGESGQRHHPEFSMLEWYRAGADTQQLAEDSRALLQAVCRAALDADTFTFQGRMIDLAAAWELLSVDEAFERYAGTKLDACPDDFAFDTALVEKIEPQLGLRTPTVLHSYPACFCPMARPLRDRGDRAERFEIYIAGVELANGCAEQTDRRRQEAALHEERRAREAAGKDPYPWPKEFVASLEHLPSSAGIALGIDRLAMLLCDARSIDDVIAFGE